ncbi:helix-turn-helix domain-containing protein [Fructilactobacillus cliffordii]|uniref:helix-turn-helix domain-containing protein n=1 Tax=Fructilactobacillus cliffordii TaxID=2940299 RepID=UPI002093CA25|nr:helix-turn-helix domain-containing protein [Fructilactobacillus cliffordii]USS86858.1 helix-turn-helix domain-containing protein [Fructilactobacillus cliffordii]
MAIFAKSENYLDKQYNPDNPSYQFTITPLELQTDKKLNSNDKAIIARLVSLSNNNNGYCYATDKVLSTYVGCTVRSIGNSLRKLSELGYIYKESRFTDNDITTTKRKIYVHPTIKRLYKRIQQQSKQNKKGSAPF